MRILHIIKDLEPGGIQSLLLDLIHNTDKSTVIGVFAMGRGRLLNHFEQSNVPFYLAPKRLPIDFSTVRKLSHTIKEFKPDVIHTHHTAEMVHASLAIGKNVSIKKVHTYHSSPFRGTWKDLILTRYCEKFYNVLITPSQALKTDMAECGYKKVNSYKVIPNGVDTARILNRATKYECRKKLGLDCNAYYIGMSGSFYAGVRDQLTLIKAFAKMKETDSPVYLIFAGATQSTYFKDNAYFKTCEQLVNNMGLTKKVFFINHIDDIKHFYGALDIYVHSSLHDTFGLAPVEAAFNNLPIILSDLTVFREVFINNPDIRYFPLGKDDILTPILDELIRNPSIIQYKNIDFYTSSSYSERLLKAYS